jgi:hypothetical protein
VTYNNRAITYADPVDDDGDWNVINYRLDGGTADTCSWFIDFDTSYNIATSTRWTGSRPVPRINCDRNSRWPLGDIDYGQGGAGGSAVRWPSCILRGFEISGFDHEGNEAPIRINHPLQCTMTRHAESGADAAAIMLAYKTVWPAYGRDGLRGPDSNTGWVYYGTRFGIPRWLWPLRDSTSANKIRINGVDYWLDLDTRGKALFDCFAHYGMHAFDGSGSPGGTTTKGRIELRCDQGIRYSGYAGDLRGAINTQLAKIFGLSANTFCCLYPLKNPRKHNVETEKVAGKELYYAGGGGPADSSNPAKSINTAYNATAPGY